MTPPNPPPQKKGEISLYNPFHSKHRTAKMTAESAKNVINITKTISERQQLRAVSVYYNSMFNFAPLKLPEIVSSKSQLSEGHAFNTESLKNFMANTDLLCSTIFVNNQQYCNGDILVLDIEDIDNITVGLVQTILIRGDKVHFVVQKYEASRNFLQYFESREINDTVSHFIESTTLADFKPLIKRGTTKKFVFVLHHHVSFQYQ